MAGKKGRSGRPKIPEGAQKQKDGEMFYRKNGRWIKLKTNATENKHDLDAPLENKNSSDNPEPNRGNEQQEDKALQFSNNKNDLERAGNENDQQKDHKRVLSENARGVEDSHSDRSENKDDKIGLSQEANLENDFSEMEALLDSAPDPDANTGLEAPPPEFDEAEEESGGQTISGEMLLRILDFGGRFAGAFILQKYFKKDAITRDDLKMTREEREELQEFADEAAATINFQAAGNPWLSLIIAYAIILAMKIEDV